MAAFGKISAPSLKEICVQAILTKILSGELKPGDRLPTEMELSEFIARTARIVKVSIFQP